jgi:hypothetical protein
MTVCPTYKLIRGLVSTFDEDSDLTLTAEEKAVLLTTVATNPDLAIQRYLNCGKIIKFLSLIHLKLLGLS